MFVRALVVVSLLALGSSAWAENQDGQGGEAKVYSTTGCFGGGTNDCFVTASSVFYPGFPNPNVYTTFATLTLPAGNYLLHGKLSYWVRSPTWVPTWGNTECFMGLSGEEDGDWSSAGIKGDQYVVAMMAPMKLTGRSTTIKIGCRVWGGYVPPEGGDPLPAEVAVWGVRLVAERVGAVVGQ